MAHPTQNQNDLVHRSTFDRLGTTKASIIGCSQDQVKAKGQGEESIVGKIHSHIPSRMKHKSILDITTEGSLKVKRWTIIHTTQSHIQDQQEIEEASPALEDREQTTFDEVQDVYKIIDGDDVRINPIDGRLLKHSYT